MLANKISFATAAGYRFLISQTAGYLAKPALFYNAVDMAISAVAFKSLSYCKTDKAFAVISTRVIGVIAGLVATNLVFGPIPLRIAVISNLGALMICSLINRSFGAYRNSALLF